LPAAVKDRISHRAKALADMRVFLNDLAVTLDRSSGHP
jgi:inosine/xanthosine triphosphate pyrophosphatase family protein